MFVLCPHCHFLVGMDPRTGGPPAACPKCGGSVVQPIAPPTPDAPALDPFVEAALPSVAPTLPAADPVVDAIPEAKPAKASTPARPAARGSEATEAREPREASPIVAPPSSAAATTPATTPNTPSETAPAPADDGHAVPAPAVVASGEPTAGTTTTTRPSPDEMIAAFATRPARKPRAPRTRTKKSAAPPSGLPEAAAGPPPESVAPSPPAQAPSAAAGLGARLRALFVRAPRQPGAGNAVASDGTSTPTSTPASTSDASPVADPATPALSIRHRGRRLAAKPVSSVPTMAGPTPGSMQAPAAIDEPAPDVVAARVAAAPSSAPASAASSGSPPAAAAQDVDSDPMLRRDAGPASIAHSPGADVRVRDEPGPDDEPPSAADATGAPVAPGQVEAPAMPPVAVAPMAAAQVEPATAPLRPAPSFATARATAGRTRRDYRAIAVVVALSSLLGLQLLLAQRAALAADPGWRPTVAALCTLLQCELPPWREPAAFTMLSRHVRPHPDAPGTLLIDASFRNDARWPQPWPRLELILSDIDGRTVGARTFEVRDYLGTAPAQPELAPGQSASLSLAVVEPAPDIVAFTFDFR